MIAKYNYKLYLTLIIVFCITAIGCGSAKTQMTATSDATEDESKTKPSAKVPNSETRSITLEWDDVPNATFYNIYWSDKPGVNKGNGTKISNVKSPHTIEGLEQGKTYYFVVTAVNASAESNESEELLVPAGQ